MYIVKNVTSYYPLQYFIALRTFFLYLSFSVGTSFFLQAAAQQLTPINNKSKKAFETAKRCLDRNDYKQAIVSLQEVLAHDSLFVVAHQQLADIYLRQKEYDKALKYYKNVSTLAPNLTTSTWFGLGESALNLRKYEEARSALLVYLTKISTQNTPKKLLVEKYLKDCNFSIQATKDKQDIKIVNMGKGINSTADEYFPMLTADKNAILFTRQASGKLEYIFMSEHHRNDWNMAIPIPGDVNTDSYSEGAHCISPDGKYLFFTGCNKPEGIGSCDIYVSHLEDSQWGVPHNLGSPINTNVWEAQPAINADGNKLYFVSNRKGGYGGNDIWCSTLTEGGKWSAPINLGPKINTPYDEGTPFIHADQETLYFSSNGWPGFGNKDLFVSKLDSSGNRITPINLGSPINNHLEQRALTVSMDGEEAFFATEIPNGFGGLDIYTFQLPRTIRPKPMGFVKGKVYNKRTGQALAAEISLTNLNNNQVIFKTAADYTDGTFLAPLPLNNQYALHVSHPSYLFFTQHITLNDSVSMKDFYQVKIPLTEMNPGNTVTLNNIFFPINGYNLLPLSQADLMELVHFMDINKKVKIEISGHTDNTGRKEDNQILSEKRAFAVYSYLLSKGIERSRMEYKGYGQGKPIASNDTEEGKQKNRRTDFKILAIDYVK